MVACQTQKLRNLRSFATPGLALKNNNLVESEYYEFTEGLDPGLDSIALKEKKDLVKKSEQENNNIFY